MKRNWVLSSGVFVALLTFLLSPVVSLAASLTDVSIPFLASNVTSTSSAPAYTSVTGSGAVTASSGGWDMATGTTDGSSTLVRLRTHTGDVSGGRWERDMQMCWNYRVYTASSGGTVFQTTMGDNNSAGASTGVLTGKHEGFIWGKNGGVLKLWATNADGTTQTKTDISSGLSWSNTYNYCVVHTAGVDVKFYVDGTLKATHTTNLPTASFASTSIVWNDLDTGNTSQNAAELHWAEWKVLTNVSSSLPSNASGWLKNDGAGALSWSTPTSTDTGSVPTSGTINGYDLTANRTLTPTDIGLPANAGGWLHNNGSGTLVWSTPNASDVGALDSSTDLYTLGIPADASGCLENDGAGALSWVSCGGGGVSLPADAAGWLENDGGGSLSWSTPSGGSSSGTDLAGIGIIAVLGLFAVFFGAGFMKK